MADYSTDASKCPYCGVKNSIVFSTDRTNRDNPEKDGYYFHYRECKDCGERWRTYEIHAKEFQNCRWALNGLIKLAEKYGGDCNEPTN